MRLSPTRGAAVLGAGLILAGLGAAPAPAKTPPPDLAGATDIAAAGGPEKRFDAAGREFVGGELLVRFRPGAERARARRAEDARLKRELPAVADLELLELPRGTSPQAAARSFERRADVLYAEPNYVRRGQATTNDSRLAEYWGLHNTGQAVKGVAGLPDADMDVPEAWNVLQSSPNVTVAVLDSGAAYDHPDLAANMWSNPGEACTTALPNRCKDGVDNDGNGFKDDVHGYDFINGDGDPRDDHGHGSHVGGTIGARGNNDVAGAGPTDGTGVTTQVKLQAIKVLDGTNAGTLASIIQGVDYARRSGVKLANVSIGAASPSQAERDAFAAASGVLFVVSAGNDGADNDTGGNYPCAYPLANIVCVAATDQSDRFAGFSNYGATSVDLAAPGQSILSTLPALRTVFSDDFEINPITSGRWTRGGTPNTWNWTDEVFAGESGHSLTDSPNAAYAANANNWARRTAAANLTGLRECALHYTALIDAETGYDGVVVEATRSLTGQWTPLAVLTGEGQGRLFDPLRELSGQPGVFVRFRFISDESEQWSGVFIDNLSLRCAATTYTGADLGFLNGTSMAAPAVTGVAALMFARYPGLTVAGARSRLLLSVDRKPALDGTTTPGKKVATGGRMNAYKALAESTAGVAGGVLTVTAGPGTANAFSITRITEGGIAKYRVADPYGAGGSTGSRVVPAAGCVADGPLAVKCAASAVTGVRVLAGDQNDTVAAGTLTVPVTVDGGAGNDTITTGAGRDTLTGGTGVDRFTAGAASDTINARDEVIDGAFACGESTGDADTVNADLQPADPVSAAALNCEVVNKL